MAWIAAAVAAVGGIVQTGMKADAAKGQIANGGSPGGMDLGKMMFHDASMNNGGMIVTTGGSSANAAATTDRTTSPSTSAMLPMSGGLGGYGYGQSGGIDLMTIAIGLGLMLMLKKG